MKSCDDVRLRLTELALGDLDAEPARDVRDHLAGCAACRVEEAATGRTLGLLKSALPPSTERRLVAVQAMVEAREAAPSRRRWLAVAAAVLLAAGLTLAWSPWRSAGSWTAAEVVGRAERFRASEGRFAALAPGERIAAGDRVVVVGGSVRLERRGATVALEPGTSMGLMADGRLALERGALRIEAPGASAVSVLDTVNDTVTIRRGRATVGLRQVRGMIAGSFETQGEGSTSAPAAREVTAERLAVRLSDGEADLEGSHRQRLRLTSGQEGGFEFDGRPFTKGEAR